MSTEYLKDLRLGEVDCLLVCCNVSNFFHSVVSSFTRFREVKPEVVFFKNITTLVTCFELFALPITWVINLGSVRTTPEKVENAALLLLLGVSSALIRQENRAFRKYFSIQRNLKTTALCFTADKKNFKTGAFRKRPRGDNHVISLPKLSLSTNPT